MSMKKYFTIACNTKKLVITSLGSVPTGYEKRYTELNEEQLAYLENNPNADANTVLMCGKNLEAAVEKTVEEPVVVLEDYKDLMLRDISQISLNTSREKVSDYQFLNAQASLLLEDGDGIYSHEESNKIIKEYNSIGKQCREKYYEFEKELELLTDKESIDELVSKTNNWYLAL